MENRHNIESSYDVVVVGARVAGAATAMLLARAGKRVLAVDKSAYGSDTTSTHAIMRAGVMQLHRWGVLDRIEAAGTPAIHRTTFHYGEEAVAVDIKERDGIDALVAPRRTVIDAILVDAAREAGAQVEYGVVFEDVLRDAAGRVRGVRLVDSDATRRDVAAGMVIGADGIRSRVARKAGAEVLQETHRVGSVIYAYVRGLDLDGTHWYYNTGVAAGVIPTNDGAACVFAGMPPERYRSKDDIGLEALFNDVLRETDPALARQVAGGERIGKLHPFAGAPGFIRQSWGPGWALVGDASCFKDPITAHGMTDALRDAELLANAILAGGDGALSAWQADRDAFASGFMRLTEEIASFEWDLDSVKPLHRELSRMMNAECDTIRALDATESAAV